MGTQESKALRHRQERDTLKFVFLSPTMTPPYINTLALLKKYSFKGQLCLHIDLINPNKSKTQAINIPEKTAAMWKRQRKEKCLLRIDNKCYYSLSLTVKQASKT